MYEVAKHQTRNLNSVRYANQYTYWKPILFFKQQNIIYIEVFQSVETVTTMFYFVLQFYKIWITTYKVSLIVA